MADNATPPVKRDRRGCPPGQGVVASQPVDGAPTGYIGNPPHERSDEIATKVRENARSLLPIGQIAALAGVDRKTIYRHYRRELELGRAETLSMIAAQEVKTAMSGSSPEIKGEAESRRFVLSRMLGLLSREQPPPDLEPSTDPATGIDLSLLTPEELAIYGRLSAKAAGLDPDRIEFEIVGDDEG